MLFKYICGTKYIQGRELFSTLSRVKTIFALSSGQGKCGVAVVRVSGPEAGTALKLLTATGNLPKPRYAHLKYLRNPKTKEVLDRGIVLWFPGPNSFTGEDSCELQIHGGVAVVTAVLKALTLIPNLRLAEPGEFSRRAFYNGKLDLTEVEGLADLLSAETEFQRKQAFLQSDGHLSKIYQLWKKTLIKCLANLEAYIDFDETETIDSNLFDQVIQAIQEVKDAIQQHLNDGRKGERLRRGVKTVIIGEPNVGKSSLLNMLSQRPVAIVTPIEGTTTDVLEVTLDIGGYPLVLADTAGLRANASGIIEKEGIKRATEAYKTADFILLIIDGVKYLTWSKANPNKSYVKYYLKQLNMSDPINDAKNELDKHCLIIINKIDLIQSKDLSIFQNSSKSLISCKLESGVPLLLEKITEKLKMLCGEPSEHPSMNQIRHRHHLTQCLQHLQLFLDQSSTLNGTDTVLLTEEVRKAVRQIGKITGTITTEQLLDIIFKDFCIGK